MPVAERYEGRRNLKRISAITLCNWIEWLGMTQTECAAFLNVDPRTVRAWCLGERPTSGPAITALELKLSMERRVALQRRKRQ